MHGKADQYGSVSTIGLLGSRILLYYNFVFAQMTHLIAVTVVAYSFLPVLTFSDRRQVKKFSNDLSVTTTRDDAVIYQTLSQQTKYD